MDIMEENKKLRIGIIGMGRISWAHTGGLSGCPDAVITAVCDINPDALNSAGDRLNIPKERRFTDYHDLIACPEVDAVEICTPNYLHVPMATDVIRAGKPVNIEKPLGATYEGIPELLEAYRENPQPNMMCFSYRFMPAVRYAKELLDAKKLGKIVSVDVEYLQSGAFIEGRRLEWRFDKKKAGTGAIGDLGVHLIDMTRYLLGDITAVCACKKTVVKERKLLDSEEYGEVKTDDFCTFIADLECGAAASFTVTRCARGHSNTIKYDIYGTDGVISFNLNNPKEIYLCIGDDVKTVGLHKVDVPPEYAASQEGSFVDIALGRFKEKPADIFEGAKCQKVVDAIDLSGDRREWVTIEY